MSHANFMTLKSLPQFDVIGSRQLGRIVSQFRENTCQASGSPPSSPVCMLFFHFSTLNQWLGVFPEFCAPVVVACCPSGQLLAFLVRDSCLTLQTRCHRTLQKVRDRYHYSSVFIKEADETRLLFSHTLSARWGERQDLPVQPSSKALARVIRPQPSRPPQPRCHQCRHQHRAGRK